MSEHGTRSAGSSAEIAPDPPANAIRSTLGQATTACEAVLHMHGQLRLPPASRTLHHVVGDAGCEIPGQLTIDMGVDVLAVAEVLEVQHGEETR